MAGGNYSAHRQPESVLSHSATCSFLDLSVRANDKKQQHEQNQPLHW